MALGDEISDVASFIGRQAGNIGRQIQNVTGFTDSGLAPEEEAFGMNPRRAYWSAALADLANFSNTGQMQGTGMQVNQQQQNWQENLRRRKVIEDYQRMNAMTGMMKAMQGPKGTTLERNLAAAGYTPGTPEYQEAMRKAMEKGPLVDMGQDWQSQIMGQLPDAFQKASTAREDIGRYERMLELSQSGQLGNTGPGKNAMVNFKGFLNAMGMQGAANFIDGVGEIAGVDLFSGDQGAQEFYRALNTQDVIGKARELYPVSDRDMAFLMQMTPALNVADDDARNALIRGQMERANRDIQYYDFLKGRLDLPEGQGTIPLPEIPTYDFGDDDYSRRLEEALK